MRSRLIMSMLVSGIQVNNKFTHVLSFLLLCILLNKRLRPVENGVNR